MANSNRVTIDKLDSELNRYLNEYKEHIDEDVKELSDKMIKEARNELRSISPRSKKSVQLRGREFQNPGDYAKGWGFKNGKKYKDVYSKISYNKIYRLTHLLEFGHASRNGKRVAPIPHIRKTEDKYRNKFINELELKIRRF